MKEKQEIVANWLPRYTGVPLEEFGEHIPVDEVARKAGTIAWEILTGITPRVVRCHVG